MLFKIWEMKRHGSKLEDNFTLLLDKNNTAYKALQTLQKESEEADKVYCYMDK